MTSTSIDIAMVEIEEITSDATEKQETQIKYNTKIYDKSKENLSPAQISQVTSHSGVISIIIHDIYVYYRTNSS